MSIDFDLRWLDIDPAFFNRLTRIGLSAVDPPAITCGELLSLVTFAKFAKIYIETCAIPCQSCGADPRISPPSGKELPVVKGALDAQAEAEKNYYLARRECEAMRSKLRDVESTIAYLRLQIQRSSS
jgi:hypothetical protein